MSSKNLILIVDDTPSARDILEAFLRALDYQIAFAVDGPEAIAKASELTPDLILLDVMMPGMDGFEVCRRIRAHSHLAEVPIILVTALDDRSSRLQGLAAGADDFLSKPVDVAELRARVNTVMRLNRYRRLLEQRSRFEWVVEKAGDGYLVLGSNDEILYANPSARFQLELPPNLTLPSTASLRALIAPRFRCEPIDAWERWFTQKTHDNHQALYLIRPETAVAPAMWLEVIVREQSGTGNGEQLLHLRDVTAQRSTQRDTWTFHSMIMHKLNTPIQTMMGSLEMLSTFDATDLVTEDARHLINFAYTGSRRLNLTINDILQYLKTPMLAQAGEGLPMSALPGLIKQISSELGLHTQVNASFNLNERCLVLSSRAIECILWELLENAKKFHPSQSPQVEVSLEHQATRTLQLIVSDDGVTLSPEQILKVWSPYYQGEKYHTGEIPGAGLGLSMVAALVWETGGGCHFRNRATGPGVEVELTLPLA